MWLHPQSLKHQAETSLPKVNVGDNLPNESELTIQTYQ
jgi:hypothetical protein